MCRARRVPVGQRAPVRALEAEFRCATPGRNSAAGQNAASRGVTAASTSHGAYPEAGSDSVPSMTLRTTWINVVISKGFSSSESAPNFRASA